MAGIAKIKNMLSGKLLSRAKEHLVGGVNSPVRSFKHIGGDPVLIKKGKAAHVYDYEGKEYIDYVLSYGAMMLGHAHEEVVNAVKKAAEDGFNFGTTGASEIELASLMKEAVPFIDKVRFVTSGTEAVMSAVRVARGFTGREKIIKFTNSYHGHADQFLAEGGSGLASLNIPFSGGVPEDFIKHTLVLDHGDRDAIARTFKENGGKIAAVIVEPVGGNYGVTPPDKEFLDHLRKITQEHKALLIFDEVITGFRFSYGTFAQDIRIEPDLVTFGKIIGGGLPIGAYAGKNKIMEKLAPVGDVYQASTFAGNPLVMQAGIATLRSIGSRQGEYDRLEGSVKYLAQSILEEARAQEIDLEVSYYGTMFSFKFKEKEDFKIFYRKILEEGIYFAPSEYEANFLSFAHTTEDIEKTILASQKAIKHLKKVKNGR
ncbi:MAG: glutamate-1-semialdehyde 2,1-aminomutase [Candidatus Omnitrophica bacterium]|nr:glutamate-1-semialdehyde 2,1-aminomutase [Candidatus Omnitrophota bacterium]